MGQIGAFLVALTITAAIAIPVHRTLQRRPELVVRGMLTIGAVLMLAGAILLTWR